MKPLKKLFELQSESLYSVETEISPDLFGSPSSQQITIFWFAENRRETFREYSPKWIADCTADENGEAESFDEFVAEVINEMFNESELEALLSILKVSAFVTKINITKYNVPLTDPPLCGHGMAYEMSPYGRKMFALSDIIQQPTIQTTFNNLGISIKGCLIRNIIEKNEILR